MRRAGALPRLGLALWGLTQEVLNADWLTQSKLQLKSRWLTVHLHAELPRRTTPRQQQSIGRILSVYQLFGFRDGLGMMYSS